MRLIDADTIFNGNLLMVRAEAYDAVHAVIEKINNAPTVDAELVRHGHWVEEIGMFLCSECGDAWGTEMEEMVRSFKYCPNCGAKMDEEEE